MMPLSWPDRVIRFFASMSSVSWLFTSAFAAVTAFAEYATAPAAISPTTPSVSRGFDSARRSRTRKFATLLHSGLQGHFYIELGRLRLLAARICRAARQAFGGPQVDRHLGHSRFGHFVVLPKLAHKAVDRGQCALHIAGLGDELHLQRRRLRQGTGQCRAARRIACTPAKLPLHSSEANARILLEGATHEAKQGVGEPRDGGDSAGHVYGELQPIRRHGRRREAARHLLVPLLLLAGDIRSGARLTPQ